MMMRVVDGIESKAITVEVTREIRVDGLYKIQPTEAFLGIEHGTIQVLHIGDLPSLLEYSEDVSSQADAFCEAMLDLMSDDYVRVTDERFRTQPWVVYKYMNKEISTLPLEEFVEHTTHY